MMNLDLHFREGFNCSAHDLYYLFVCARFLALAQFSLLLIIFIEVTIFRMQIEP